MRGAFRAAALHGQGGVTRPRGTRGKHASRALCGKTGQGQTVIVLPRFEAAGTPEPNGRCFVREQGSARSGEAITKLFKERGRAPGLLCNAEIIGVADGICLLRGCKAFLDAHEFLRVGFQADLHADGWKL